MSMRCVIVVPSLNWREIGWKAIYHHHHLRKKRTRNSGRKLLSLIVPLLAFLVP
jgi:hypothetical protein